MTGPLVHDALIYSSDEEFVSVLAPFLGEAVAAGEPAIAVTTQAKAGLLRDALGSNADRVSYHDATEFYRRPARTLTAYGAMLNDLLRSNPERVRVVGEIPFRTTVEEHAQWMRYEAVLNRGLAGRQAWIVCAHDTRALPESVIADAYRTHPFVWTNGQRATNASYRDADELGRQDAAVPGGNELIRSTASDERSAIDARRSVAGAARAGGLADELVDDLVLVISDLQRKVLDAGGEASVRILRDRARWICEVTGVGVDESLGVATARLITENVDISTGTAPTMRMTFESGTGDVRGRILDAASELFYRDGVRATGVMAIIANAGVAKASFYHHFPSKDDVITAWLQRRNDQWLDRFVQAQKVTPPRERLLVWFDLMRDWFAEEDYRGCAPVNAVAELPENESARRGFQDMTLKLREHFGRAAREAGYIAPAEVVEELLFLVLGASVMAAGHAQPDAGQIARRAAVKLLASAPRA
jgi:AcrR family transcriptional regulator